MVTSFSSRNLTQLWRFSLALVFSAVCLPVMAQEYKEDPIPESLSQSSLKKIDQTTLEGKKAYSAAVRAMNGKTKKYRDIAINSLRGVSDVNANLKDFELWFTKVEIPQLTKSDVESLRSLPLRRQKFMKTYVTGPGSGNGDPGAKKAAYERLVRSILLPTLGKIILNNDKPTYAPAVKVNALLMIGDLDLVLGRSSYNPPIPLPDCMKFMLNYVMKSDKVPGYLKPVAMIGLERHALLDSQLKSRSVSEDDRKALQDVCVSILEAEPVKGEEDLDYWMKRKSAKILGYYGSAGAENKIAVALMKTIDDPVARLWLRFEAAEAYGKLKFPNEAAASSDQFTLDVGKLTLQALRDEENYLSSERERLMVIKLRQNAVLTTGSGGGLSPSSATSEGMNQQQQAEEMAAAAAAEAVQRAQEEQMLLQSGDPMGLGGDFDVPVVKPEAKPIESPYDHEEDTDELPEYKVHVSRIRLKTIAMRLEQAISEEGFGKYCKSEASKRNVEALRSSLKKINVMSNYGIERARIALTLDLISSIEATADGLAKGLNVKESEPVEIKKVLATLKGSPDDEMVPVAGSKVADGAKKTTVGAKKDPATIGPKRVNGKPEKAVDPFDD